MTLPSTNPSTTNPTTHTARRLGNYRICRKIGSGGMGTVYEAVDENLDLPVAVKVLHGAALADDQAIRRFHQEAKAIASLEHEHIIKVYTFGEHEGTHYYAMKLLEGVSLGTTLHSLRSDELPPANPFDPTSYPRGTPGAVGSAGAGSDPSSGAGRPPSRSAVVATRPAHVVDRRYVETAVEMIAQIADALQHAHDHGVYHRDVKPSNLLLAGPNKLILADFGLAVREGMEGMTRVGVPIGTPPYMSPEQARGEEVDPRTDIYSLGVTLYELLTLRHPFEDLSRKPDRASRRTYLPRPWGEPHPFRTVGARLGRDLELIVMTAIQPDPARRYQKAGQLADDLKAFLQREPLVWARPPGALATIRRQIRRYRRPLLAAAASFVFLAGLFGFGWWQQAREVDGLIKSGNAHLDAARDAAKSGPPDKVKTSLDDAQIDFSNALKKQPDNTGSLEGLFKVHLARCEQALAAGGYERALGMIPGLEQLDRDRGHAEQIEAIRRRAVGLGGLEVASDPPGAGVELFSLDAQYQPGAKKNLGKTPVARQQILPGNYLLTLSLDGVVVRYPLRVERNEELVGEKNRVFVQMVRKGDKPGELLKGMVYVPAGRFLFHNHRTAVDEEISLPGFFIDETEVTGAEYEEFLQKNPSASPPLSWTGSRQCPNYMRDEPVHNVSWFDAYEYARVAKKRLPTEQEWEKAARGADGRQYPWGDVFHLSRCINRRSLHFREGLCSKQCPTGASPYGCYDMAGNVWEWTDSREQPGSAARILRGGAAYCDADQLLTYRRHPSPPGGSDVGGPNLIGFRCVRSLASERPLDEVVNVLVNRCDLSAACELAAYRGQWDEVHRYAARMVGLNTRSGPGNFWTACAILAKGGPLVEATTRLRVVMGQRPLPSNKHLELLDKLLGTGRLDPGVREAYELAVKLRTATQNLSEIPGTVDPTRKQLLLRQTRGLLEDVLKVDDNYETAHGMMIEVAGELNFPDERARHAGRYVELLGLIMLEDGYNPALHGEAALLLVKYKERLEDALRFARKAVQLDPDHPDYQYALGMALFMLEQHPDEARRAARRAVELNPTVQAYQNLQKLIEVNMFK